MEFMREQRLSSDVRNDDVTICETRTEESGGASSYDFHVVGVGASAGGLESLENLFSRVPRDSGLAFVVVQHLSPDFKSLMDELLSRKTDIPIRQAEEGLAIEPNTIFLIPPKKEAILSGRRFRLRDKEPREALTLPIDHFFRSLAQEAGPLAIAVILSGSGSDGSRGICDVHRAKGLVICETEETAKFDGMPLSAQETGFVDLVLRPEEIPAALARHVTMRREGGTTPISDGEDLVDGVDTIFKLLQSEYGIDFSSYKSGTVGRRIQRRLSIRQLQNIQEYAARLKSDPEELNSLYRDLLIGVTHFFRDPEAFEVLESTVIPPLVERAKSNEEIRVWVAGCATGEEAYSIAILIHEHLERLGLPINLKIFATDVHSASLEIASQGEYSAEAINGISESRLQRYFEPTRGSYTVIPELRKLIVFAPHNLTKDAPFTKMDMIACRNLLIYFQPSAQKKVISLFHFGLKTGGVLFMGPSESPGELSDEFDAIDGHWKIFCKRRDTRLPADMRFALPRNKSSAGHTPVRPIPVPGVRSGTDMSLVGAYDWMLAKYMPAAVLIDDRHELLHVFGAAESYLRFKPGRPSSDALELFEDGLRTVVVSAVLRAKKDLQAVSYSGVKIASKNKSATYCVSVEPVENKRSSRQQYLITIQPIDEKTPLVTHTESMTPIGADVFSTDRINALEGDLRFAQESLQATIEELETANEELQAANEELVASNEELQSTNEELHSVNEELYTVNAEYQKKIIELTELTADMDNLMECTDVATVFLDRDLRIRKFTPQIVPIFRILSQDVGRCIDNFAHHLKCDNLLTNVKRVLESGVRVEEEIQTHQGKWVYLRILPYRSDRVVQGAVLTLIDIDTLKRAEQSLAEALRDREGFLAVLSHELRNPINAVLSASHLLRPDRPDPDIQQHAIGVIQRQSQHIARLLEDLLDLSRMTQDKLELRREKFDLRDSVEAAVESARPSIRQHGQSLDLKISTHPLQVDGDAHRIRQVIINLLVNASKYSPERGVIRLEAIQSGQNAIIRVIDNGHGISPEVIEAIFRPFVQLPRTRDRHEGGMGVGLSLAKNIVERHNGTINAYSEGDGKGSEFTVTIPLFSDSRDSNDYHDKGYCQESVIHPSTHVKDHVERNDRPAPPEQTGRQKNWPRRIAIVEDQSDNRETLRAILALDGFEVSTANDGETGIELILQESPDVAIVDLGLPKINGYGVARNARARLNKQIMLIALTGHGGPEDIKAAREAGFDAHLVKPLDLNQLKRLLETRKTD